MKTIITALLIALPAFGQENVDLKEARLVLAGFNTAYRRAGENEGCREAAISNLRQKLHPILLERLIDVGMKEDSVKVRAVVADALGEYTKSEKAAEALAGWLRKDQFKEEFYVLDQRCLQSLGRLSPDVARKQIKAINAWFAFRDGGSAKSAVMAAALIRDKSSIEPLIAELERVQFAMRKWLESQKIGGCDGG